MTIYNSTRWRRLRKHQLSIEPLCRICKRPATDVDHIVPISQGGEAWDRDNLQSLCHEHHSIKTAAEKTGRQWAGEVGPDGLPRGGSHWWGKVSGDQSADDDGEWWF